MCLIAFSTRIPIDCAPIPLVVIDPVGAIDRAVHLYIAAMVRIQHIGAPNNGDTLQVIAQLKHNAIDVISMAEKDLPILIQRGVRGDVGPFASLGPNQQTTIPPSRYPGSRQSHASP